MTGGSRLGVHSSIEELVGDTPLLRLSYPDVPDSVRLLAKLEMFNPLSSVKDRAARHMMLEAERTGALDPAGGVVVEATSGNMGISLAALCSVRGHRLIVVMPDNATEERRQLMRMFGAEIIPIDHRKGLAATMALAAEVHRSIPGSCFVGQDQNPDNQAAHYASTGPEIWDALDGEIDVLVCGVGTGGTLSGTARYLKQRRDIHVVALEPAGSPVMSGGEPGPHRIPGIGEGIVQGNTDLSLIDEILTVTDEDAALASKYLATKVGLLVGISAGAAAWGSRTLAARPEWANATIVTVFPDTGERYLSIWDGEAT